VEQTAEFERERARLVRIAARILRDDHEAEDIVQLAWLRLRSSAAEVADVAGWATTVTTRLCIDRLRARVPVAAELEEDRSPDAAAPDPLEAVEQREAVGQALHVVADRLSPNERVALVLHESFGYDFAAIGEMLDRSPAAARKLASRAHAKVADAERGGPTMDDRVVDAFMAAAKGSDLIRLLSLLAPGATVSADAAAIAAGTPQRIEGREAVAEFFNGSAHAALPSLVLGRPGAAWFHLGEPRVAFDFSVQGGVVQSIVFRAAPEVLAGITRRRAVG
jgi:RNA polymerase sigma factor (sigma-70 family)